MLYMIVVLNFCFGLELLLGMPWNFAQTNGRAIRPTYNLVPFLQALSFCSSKRPVDHDICHGCESMESLQF